MFAAQETLILPYSGLHSETFQPETLRLQGVRPVSAHELVHVADLHIFARRPVKNGPRAKKGPAEAAHHNSGGTCTR